MKPDVVLDLGLRIGQRLALNMDGNSGILHVGREDATSMTFSLTCCYHKITQAFVDTSAAEISASEQPAFSGSNSR